MYLASLSVVPSTPDPEHHRTGQHTTHSTACYDQWKHWLWWVYMCNVFSCDEMAAACVSSTVNAAR
jgi:hypothetical protein